MDVPLRPIVGHQSFPNFPGSLPLKPQSLKQAFVARCVHALPKAFMPVRCQLSIRSKPFERVDLKRTIVSLKIIKDRWFTNHEAAVDPPFANLWLFSELRYQVAVKNKAAEACRRTHGSHGGHPPVRTMKLEQVQQIYVAHAVTVSDHKSIVFQPGLKPFDAAASVCFQPGVLQMYNPIFTFAIFSFDLAVAKVNRHVPSEAGVVEEKLLNDFAFVTESDNEFFEAVVFIMLHDMPDQRSSTDLDHGLGPDLSFFSEARAYAAG